MESHDVVVIGAGLAGLRCAARLALAGRDVLVLEASDAVGGRQRTDAVDGFLLDRGFQVLNPAYPAVGRWVDVQSLRMRHFPVGVGVRRDAGTAELWHPLRHPSRLPRTLRSGLVDPRELLALARWTAPALVAPQRVAHGPDRTLREAWARRGRLRREVLEPFLAGVLADDRGETSDAFVRLLARAFALGRPGVPEKGIGALPAQLAQHARAFGAEIRLSHRVTALRDGEVSIDGADPVSARDVVVAVGPDAVTDLVDIPRPQTRGLQTWWFATADPPASPLVHVDGRRAGPVVNTVVMTHTAPSYAPAGQHLVQATALLASRADEASVRGHLAEVWGRDTASWRLLRRDDIPDALPAQRAPLRVARLARVRDRVYVAGDHRDTASIQGALVSGDRVARAVLAG